MKLSILIISVLLTVCCLNVVTSQQQLYANYIPFQNSDCSGVSSGVGLVVALYKCIYNVGESLEYMPPYTTMSVAFDSKNNPILNMAIYKSSNPNGILCQGNGDEYQSYKNGTCINGSSLTFGNLFNGTTTVNGQQSTSTSYLITVSDKPQYPVNSYTISQYQPTYPCDESTFEYSKYLTNLVTVDFDEITTTYYCNSDSVPLNKQCNNGDCITNNAERTCDPAKFFGYQIVNCS